MIMNHSSGSKSNLWVLTSPLRVYSCWFDQKTTINKISKAYKLHREVDVVLKHPFPVHDGTPMSSINLHGDNYIVVIAELPSTPTPSSQPRSPLQDLHSQNHSLSSVIKSEIKPEPRYASPYLVAQHGQMPQSVLSQIKDENGSLDKLPLSRFHSLQEDISRQGNSCYQSPSIGSNE